MNRVDKPPLQFGLGSLFGAIVAVALLAWLGTSFPIVGYPILGGILFAMIPCIVALVVAAFIKVVIYAIGSVKNR